MFIFYSNIKGWKYMRLLLSGLSRKCSYSLLYITVILLEALLPLFLFSFFILKFIKTTFHSIYKPFDLSTLIITNS